MVEESYLDRPTLLPSESMSDILKPVSLVALFALVILAPSIQDILTDEAYKYVDDNESAHDGLPTEWGDKQVICIFFPVDSPQGEEFSKGVTMIDADGVELGENNCADQLVVEREIGDWET